MKEKHLKCSNKRLFSAESSDEDEGSGDEGRPGDDSDVRHTACYFLVCLKM